MYKIILFSQIFNEISKENLDRFMKYTVPLVDDMFFYDDASTDGSYEFLLKYTKNIIRGSSNDFEAEQNHKHILLQKVLELNPDFILWLDADEILSSIVTKEKLQELCQYLIDNNSDGLMLHINNIWRSKTYKRLDSLYDNLNQCKLWRVTPHISFESTSGNTSLHLPGHPPTLQNIIDAPPGIESIHYGFSSIKHLATKYFIYKAHGQVEKYGQWGIDRFIDERTLQLSKLPKEMFHSELYEENEPSPDPIPFDELFKLIQPYEEVIFNKSILQIEAIEPDQELINLKKQIIKICDQYAIKEEKEFETNCSNYWAIGTFYQRLRLKEIAELAIKLSPGNILEIGAGVGEQTVRFCELAREYNRKVIVIDPWITSQQPYFTIDPNVDSFTIFNWLIRNYKPYVKIIKDSSLDHNIVSLLKTIDIAFVFIDGLHIYDACYKDISTVWHSNIIAVDDLLQLPQECNRAFIEYANTDNSYWNKSLNEGYIIPKLTK